MRFLFFSFLFGNENYNNVINAKVMPEDLVKQENTISSEYLLRLSGFTMKTNKIHTGRFGKVSSSKYCRQTTLVGL